MADSRSSDTPSVTSLQPSRIVKALETASEAGAALAIIDRAPHSADAAMIAAEVANLILVPCRPGILDLRAIGSTARIVKVAGKPEGHAVSQH